MTLNIISPYGARELKVDYSRNLVMALLISVLIHVVAIGLYMVMQSVVVRVPVTLQPTRGPVWEVPKGQPDPPSGPTASSSALPLLSPLAWDQSRYLRPIDSVMDDSTLRRQSALHVNITVDTPRDGGGGNGDSANLGLIPGSDTGAARVKVTVTDTDDSELPPDAPVFDASEPQFDEAALQQAIVYPEAARRLGIEGTVVVRVLIDRHGKAIKTLIDRSVHPALDQSAADAVRNVTYTPAIQNGRPVPVWMQVPVAFKLR